MNGYVGNVSNVVYSIFIIFIFQIKNKSEVTMSPTLRRLPSFLRLFKDKIKHIGTAGTTSRGYLNVL